jgi:hypothetical protein
MKILKITSALFALIALSNAFASNGGHIDMVNASFNTGDNQVETQIPSSIKEDAEISFKLKEYLKTKYGVSAQDWSYAILKPQELVLVLMPANSQWVKIPFTDFRSN